MPGAAKIHFGVCLLDNGDDIRLAVYGLHKGVDIKTAEVRRKRRLLAWTQALAREKQHMVGIPGLFDFGQRLGFDGCCQINAGDHRANRADGWVAVDMLIGMSLKLPSWGVYTNSQPGTPAT